MSSLSGRGEQYRYGFFQLAPRDALVFKSIVGLLSGRMLPTWLHAEDGQLDVLVQGDDPAAEAGAQAPQAQVVLRLGLQAEKSPGPNGSGVDLELSWPLRANEIAERLQQAAEFLSRSKQPATAAAPEQDAARVVKLSRWPANALLQSDPGYVRLAALLSARAFSGHALAQRSGLSLELCLVFLSALEEQGCLLVIEPVNEPVVATETVATASPAKGFFARLRAHFGLPGTGSEAR